MKNETAPFTKVEDAFVITTSRGVRRQVDLYQRNNKLYAKQHGGYIDLMSNGDTSVAFIRWNSMKGPETTEISKIYKQVSFI